MIGHRGRVTAATHVLRLDHRAPFEADALERMLGTHVVPGLERRDAAGLTRVVPAPGGPAVVTVDLRAHPGAVGATVRGCGEGDLPALAVTLRRWLDLDADPAAVGAVLSADPLLAPLVAARPGLRVPGATDGFETAALTILGQQVSLAAARTFAGRLVAAFGAPVADGLRAFPAAAALAGAGPDRLRDATGVTGARARSLHALSVAVAGGLRLAHGADGPGTRAALLALPGVGPWTADYIAVRVLGDADAYPAGDLVLRRALGVRTAAEAQARAEAWRPYRAYALVHLWTREVFSGPPPASRPASPRRSPRQRPNAHAEETLR